MSREISGGRVRLRAGSLYAALSRLLVEGLVEFDREEIVDGRLRRYYRSTPPGARRLAAEVDRLSRTTAVARQRLKLLERPGMTSAARPEKGQGRLNDHLRAGDGPRSRRGAAARPSRGGQADARRVR